LEARPDGTGDYLDIHETLFHSKTEGFYLRSENRQALILAYLGDPETRGVRLSSNRKERPLLTVYRQMTREQVMRFFIDAYIATTNGVRQRPIAHLIKHARSVRMCALCYIPYLTP